MSYCISSLGDVIRQVDNAYIPADTGNVDYQTFLAWQASGGVPAPYVEPLPNVADYEAAVQSVLDTFAVLKGYRNSEAFSSFANSTIPAWAAEATAFCHWRDAVWQVAYAMLNQVNSGAIPQPTIAALIAALPPHP